MWAGLEHELGADLGVRLKGGLMVAETEAELAILQAKVEYESTVGLETHMLTTGEMLAHEPALSFIQGDSLRSSAATPIGVHLLTSR